MSDQPKRERYKKTEEEFTGEGMAKNEDEKEPDSNQPDYEEWSLEDLHQEARRKSVENYRELGKEELINRLKSKV